MSKQPHHTVTLDLSQTRRVGKDASNAVLLLTQAPLWRRLKRTELTRRPKGVVVLHMEGTRRQVLRDLEEFSSMVDGVQGVGFDTWALQSVLSSVYETMLDLHEHPVSVDLTEQRPHGDL